MLCIKLIQTACNNGCNKKNAAAAQEVHLRLTAVLEKIDSEKQLDVNAINQELQSIGDVSNGITSPKYDSVKTSVNSTIGAIRTYMVRNKIMTIIV